MRINFIKILLLFLVLGVTLPAIAQNIEEEYLQSEMRTKHFNKNKWEEVKKDISYKKAPKTKEENTNAKKGRGGSGGGSSRNWGGGGFNGPLFGGGGAIANLMQVLLFIGVIVLLGFIILKLLGADAFLLNPTKIKRQTSIVDLENIEDNLHESDLDPFIRQALNEKNYKLAIRLYYLNIIKELSQSRYIKWKRDKTNNDYIREMRQHSGYKNFREVTRIFERVWYGNFDLEKWDYDQIEQKFSTFLKQVKS